MIKSNIDFEIVDNFLSDDEHQLVLSECISMSYEWGESEGPQYPPSGMISEIDEGVQVYESLVSSINKTFKQFSNRTPTNCYVNLFAPKENSYYHNDAQPGYTGTTFVYYPQMIFDNNDGGETFIYDKVDDLTIAVPPKPNRILRFKTPVLHKATPFNTRHRFTVVVKYCDQIS
jgi:hypothetical protein